MSGLSEVTTAIEELNEGLQAKLEVAEANLTKKVDDKTREIDALRGRLEELESKGTGPGATAGHRGSARRYKTHYTDAGVVYELPHDVRLGDVLPRKAEPEISFERWLSAALVGEHCHDKLALAYTREQKQITTSTTGVLIPAEYQSEWIDRIRAQMVLTAAGVTTVTMDNKTLLASRLVTDPTSTWHTEAAAITAANPTFAAHQLSAQTLVTRCTGSVEVSQDSPDFGTQLAAAMAASMAVELDQTGLIGTGTAPEPRGILNTSGRGQVTGVGVLASYAQMLQGVRLLLDANLSLDVATRVAIMSPKVWQLYEGLATGITSDKTQLPRPRALEATRFLVTTNGLDVTTNSTLFLGNFADLVLGVRANASVEALRLQSYADNLILEFVGYLRADFMVRRPASFVTLEGITVP